VKAGSQKLFVIPAEAGIQSSEERGMDPGFHRGDGPWNPALGFSCSVEKK